MEEEKYINEFIELCGYNVDYLSKKSINQNNKNAKKLLRMREKITCDLDSAIKIYNILLNNSNLNILTTAASHCLKIGIHEERAINILEEISKRKDIGILAFSAEMCLKVYKGEVPGKNL